jgi:prepilin-type processing-associated H-X9-DG protein
LNSNAAKISFDYANGINFWPCCAWTLPLTSIPGRLADWGAPGSVHTGGCHVLMLDGAVRFVSENLDRVTQTNLARIGDGNAIGDF